MTTNDWTAKYEAKPGFIWVCQAYGKTSTNKAVGPRGWDEACFLNSILLPDPPAIIITGGAA